MPENNITILTPHDHLQLLSQNVGQLCYTQSSPDSIVSAVGEIFYVDTKAERGEGTLKVLSPDSFGGVPGPFAHIVKPKHCTLLKKPLTEITEDQKKIIEEIEDVEDPYSPAQVTWGPSWYDCTYNNNTTKYIRPLLIESYQKLHEWGYALPWKKWSAEELIKGGIYKHIRNHEKLQTQSGVLS